MAEKFRQTQAAKLKMRKRKWEKTLLLTNTVPVRWQHETTYQWLVIKRAAKLPAALKAVACGIRQGTFKTVTLASWLPQGLNLTGPAVVYLLAIYPGRNSVAIKLIV